MRIDVYNALEKRTGRTVEDAGALKPGEFCLRYVLAPVRGDGALLWKKAAGGLSFEQGFAPAGKSSLAAALDAARACQNGPVDIAALRLVSHRVDRQDGLIQDFYLALLMQGGEAAEGMAWVFPEEILGDPSLSAGLCRDAFYAENRDMLTRLSAEMRVPRGLYRGVQGETEEVLGVAVHTVTGVPLVICRREGAERDLRAVPLTRWLQPVRTAQGPRPRYAPEGRE